MSIQLRTYSVFEDFFSSLSCPEEVVVIGSENAPVDRENRFSYEPCCKAGLPGRIFARFPDFSDLKRLPENGQNGTMMITEFLRELFFYADQLHIHKIQILFFGEELFANDAQPLKSCFRFLSDSICAASLDTSVENINIRIDEDKFFDLLDEMDDIIDDVQQELDELFRLDEDDSGNPLPESCGRESSGGRSYSYPKDILKKHDSFGILLDQMMMARNMKPGEFERRANISRQTLSKLRKQGTIPAKYTALACAIALELSYEETDYLLGTAGYCLSDCIMEDVIVGYFIRKRMYDIDAINIVLYSESLRPLGAR